MKGIETIWKEYHGQLHHFIAGRVRDPSIADDLLQEVFVKVHQGIGTLEDESRLPSWLYQVTRNALIDHFRRQRPLESIPEETAIPEPSQNSALAELAECLRPMVESLPEDYRQAVALSELEGLTQKEAAARLGLSLSGAKSRVQRGRAKLKEMMLDCCHIEFDHRGSVVGYDPKNQCCNTCRKNA